MLKHCFTAALIGVFLTACAQKQELRPIAIQKTCQTLIASYQLESIEIGKFNDLQIPQEQVLSQLENALQASGCFAKATPNTPHHYNLQSVYGSVILQTAQGGFWQYTSQSTAIIEIRLAFSNGNETRFYNSKAYLENTADKFLGIGSSSTLDSTHIQLTLNNAIHSAINKATQDLLK